MDNFLKVNPLITDNYGMKNSHLGLKEQEELGLVKRALSGDETAWKQIIVRYKKTMKKAIKSHLCKFNGSYDGEFVFDLYQDVLVKLHRNSLDSFLNKNEDSHKSLGAFLYVVALNTARDFVRSKRGKSSLVELNPYVGDEEEGASLIDLVAVDGNTPIEIIINSEEKRLLEMEISSLGEDKKEILSLYLQGEMNIDIAKKVKRTESYVNKCVFNFKKYMKKKYENKAA